MPRERDDAPWPAGPAKVRKLPGRKREGDLIYWRAVVTVGGKEKVVWSGRCRRNDPVHVAIIMEEARKKLSGEADATAPDGGLRSANVKGLLGSWKAHQESRRDTGEISVRSFEVYRVCIRHLSKGLGDVLLEQLDRDAVSAYVRARRTGEKPASSRTVHGELVQLEAAWAWGRKRGVVPDRDLDVPVLKIEPVREKRTPTKSEVLAVLEHLEGWRRRAFVLLYATGARIKEVAHLRWRDIDFAAGENGVLNIRGKGDRPREVPIVPGLARELARTPVDQRTPDGWVVGAEPLTTRSRLLDHIATACEAAGVPRLTPHGLRRLAVDSLYEAGKDVGTVADTLGQSPSVALRYYRQARPESKLRALLDAGLGSIPEGRVVELPGRGEGGKNKK
jgi:integrase